jgi:uncharacterized protein (TIGR00369 family)
MSADPTLARERANPSAFQEHMGYELLAWEPDRAVLGYSIQPEHMNRTGRLHGGVVATLLDTTMGYSGVHADSGAGPRSCVTLSLTVNFVGAVSEGRLTIDARRTGGGKTIFFAEGNVRDAAGNLIATATGSFRYITRK